MNRTIWLIGLTSLLTDVGSEMIFPLLPMFLTGTLHASPALLGVIEGAADTLSSLLKPVAGRLSDRMGRRKPLVLGGYGLAALVRPLMALAAAPWHVLAIRLSDRVGKGLRSAPRDALLAAAAPAGQEGRAFGFHRAMDHTGALIGPLVAAVLLAAGVELRTVFGLALVPGLLALGIVAMIREEAPAPPLPAPAGAAGAAGADAPMPTRLRAWLLILLLFSLGNASDAFLLLRAGEVGIAPAALPLLWAGFHVIKIACTRVGGTLADRLPRARLVMAGWLVYALAYTGFALATSPWQICACFAVYGAFYGLTEPTEKAMIKDLTPPALRGRAYGWYHLVVGISALPAGLLAGGLWERHGSGAALGIGAALALAAALALFVWDRAGARPGRAEAQ